MQCFEPKRQNGTKQKRARRSRLCRSIPVRWGVCIFNKFIIVILAHNADIVKKARLNSIKCNIIVIK